MKLASRHIATFMEQDWQKYPIIVLFGHALDVMRRRQQQIIARAGVDTQDAFSFVRLDSARVAQDSTLLMYEACSSNLMMVPRLIVVAGKTAELTKSMTSLCMQDDAALLGNNRLLVTIEDLTAKSALLKHLTQCPWVAAVPCYNPNNSELLQEIIQFADNHPCTFSAEAKMYLLDIAEYNWDYLTQTLDKLSLYLDKNATVHSDDVVACSNMDQHYQLRDFALCAFTGNAKLTDKRLHSLLQQKVTTIALLRQLIQHCLKLLRLMKLAQKQGIDQAIAGHKPPIFFKQVPVLTQQLEQFSSHQLQQYLGELLHMEMRAKSLGSDESASLFQWLLRLRK